MDLSFASQGVPVVAALQVGAESAPSSLAKPINQTSIQHISTLVSTLALTMILPSSFQQIQKVSIFIVAKGMVPAPRSSGQDREEKMRVDLLRKVRKVSKSSACDQQNKK